ncbi:hypothetical protein LWI28_006981 [Acer negundo]|uniref:Uncharacterized protein n=1 Tax=Acer negundo TaxID=4023 RepID=A0AAD5IDI6_ACENE|nr:hypothetical protein LWI28_006981 [Acer negundo]
MSSKCMSDTEPWKEAGQVLILTPFMVLKKLQFLTVTPTTGSSFIYFPRLPTLMPWPGPHVTFVIVICRLPSPMDTQSSPVPIFESVMLIPVDRPIWIPSVLRLCSGAEMVKRLKVRPQVPQALDPCPSKVPPPDNVSRSMRWKVTQLPSTFILLGSVRAFNVPRTTILTGALQGPSKLTCANKNVPFGINTLLGLGHAHASLKALHKA